MKGAAERHNRRGSAPLQAKENPLLDRILLLSMAAAAADATAGGVPPFSSCCRMTTSDDLLLDPRAATATALW